MSRSLLRSVLDMRIPVTRLPPPFLIPSLPIQTRSFATTQAQSADSTTPVSASSPTSQPSATPSIPQTKLSSSTQATSPAAASSTISQLLPLLRAQPSHYITAHIHGRPYLLTPGDSVRLPFKMSGVEPGDILRLNRASVIGSRDYTLKGASSSGGYIDERLFEARAVVLGTETEPLRIKIKTKRRNRRVKRVQSKHKYTVLRLSELKILEPEEVEG